MQPQARRRGHNFPGGGERAWTRTRTVHPKQPPPQGGSRIPLNGPRGLDHVSIAAWGQGCAPSRLDTRNHCPPTSRQPGGVVNGTHAWAALIAGIAAYEYACITTNNHHALLSRTLDRARQRHPVVNVACIAAIAATAGHLTRIVPEQFDVYALIRLT